MENMNNLSCEIIRTGGMSQRQLSFMQGKQMVDAINEVFKIAEAAANSSYQQRELCVMIT